MRGLSVVLACSVWPPVAAIYSIAGLVVWGPLTQRDGYVITPRSVVETLKKCWGSVSASRSFLGGEYLSSVPPKVGVLQFLGNICFWIFVLGCKARIPSTLALARRAAEYSPCTHALCLIKQPLTQAR